MAAREKFYHVLFPCNGNSARSIFAEAILNHKGREHFQAYSAGTTPRGYVHPLALRELQLVGLPTAGLRSKSWREFAEVTAPEMDLVFAVCDKAAREKRPAWPLQPISGDWSIPDPAIANGTPEEVKKAFHDAFTFIQRRIDLVLNLPLDQLATLATHPQHAQRRAA